jgi:integrase
MVERTARRLTQDVVHRAVTRGNPCTLRDGQGLLLIVGRRKAGWYHEYRLPGTDPATGRRRHKKLMLLASYGPAFRLAEGRCANAEAQARTAAGRDALGERRTERRANLARLIGDPAEGMTVRELIRNFVALRSDGWRPKTQAAFAGDLRLIEAALGALPVRDVSRAQLARFLQEFVTSQRASGRKGTRAERLRALLGSLFGYAIELDVIAATPAVRLRLPANSRVAERERVLSAEEITATWRALDGFAVPSALALQLSLVTGARIGAVALATEAELELGGRLDGDTDGRPVWRLPGAAGRKARDLQIVPLSPLAVTLWRRALAWPGRNAGDPVFPGKGTGRPLSANSVSAAWRVWCRGGLLPPGAKAHDLRRTARSWWSGLKHGQDRDTLERLLGHAVGGKMQRIYDRSLYLPQQRAVADAWAAKLIELTSAPAPVLPLPVRRRA